MAVWAAAAAEEWRFATGFVGLAHQIELLPLTLGYFAEDQALR